MYAPRSAAKEAKAKLAKEEEGAACGSEAKENTQGEEQEEAASAADCRRA